MRILEEPQFTATYKGTVYSFQYGSEVYIFHTGIYNGIGSRKPKNLLEYVALVHECYLSDSNRTNLGDLADYVAEHWKTLRNKDRYEILEKYYMEA